MQAAAITALQDGDIALCFMAEINLPYRVERVWGGTWTLTTLDGRTWDGIGEFGRISDIRRESETVSPSFRLELMMPFVDAAVNNAESFAAKLRRDFRAEIRGRAATIWAQLFNATTLAPVLQPIYIDGGIMSAPEVTTSHGQASIAVTVTGRLANGAIPPNGYVTDEDQQARYPGDRFLEFVPLLQMRTVRWPRS